MFPQKLIVWTDSSERLMKENSEIILGRFKWYVYVVDFTHCCVIKVRDTFTLCSVFMFQPL